MAFDSRAQELAGHADLSTTQRYMHLSPAATEDAIRLLGVGGAGYGNRTRLAGLGSQSITTMLSPHGARNYKGARGREPGLGFRRFALTPNP